MTSRQVNPDTAFKTIHYPSFPSMWRRQSRCFLFNTTFQSGMTRKILQCIARLIILPLKSTTVFTWTMQLVRFCQHPVLHMCGQAVRQKLTFLTFKKIPANFGEKEKSYSFTLPCSQKSSYIQTDYVKKSCSINNPNPHTIGITVLMEEAE